MLRSSVLPGGSQGWTLHPPPKGVQLHCQCVVLEGALVLLWSCSRLVVSLPSFFLFYEYTVQIVELVLLELLCFRFGGHMGSHSESIQHASDEVTRVVSAIGAAKPVFSWFVGLGGGCRRPARMRDSRPSLTKSPHLFQSIGARISHRLTNRTAHQYIYTDLRKWMVAPPQAHFRETAPLLDIPNGFFHL